MRVAEVQVLAGLGHHDGVAPVGGEVHVVRIVHRDVPAGWPARTGVDRGEAVGQVVGHVQGAEVVGGHDVLRVEPGLVGPGYPEGGRVDHGHGGAAAVRHVDAVGHPAHHRAEHVRPGVGVDVRRVSDRGHARQRHGEVRYRVRDRPGHSRMRCRTGRRDANRYRLSRPGRGGRTAVRGRTGDQREDRDGGRDGQDRPTQPGQAPGPLTHQPAHPAPSDPPKRAETR